MPGDIHTYTNRDRYRLGTGLCLSGKKKNNDKSIECVPVVLEIRFTLAIYTDDDDITSVTHKHNHSIVERH